MIHTDLSPDERHQIGLSVLTAAAITLAAGLVNWSLEEAKRLLAERRRNAEQRVSS